MNIKMREKRENNQIFSQKREKLSKRENMLSKFCKMRYSKERMRGKERKKAVVLILALNFVFASSLQAPL